MFIANVPTWQYMEMLVTTGLVLQKQQESQQERRHRVAARGSVDLRVQIAARHVEAESARAVPGRADRKHQPLWG